jgi:hypothetical protein
MTGATTEIKITRANITIPNPVIIMGPIMTIRAVRSRDTIKIAVITSRAIILEEIIIAMAILLMMIIGMMMTITIQHS